MVYCRFMFPSSIFYSAFIWYFVTFSLRLLCKRWRNLSSSCRIDMTDKNVVSGIRQFLYAK